MLNKSLKLIRTVKGFDAKAVSLEIGRVPTHVSKIERENLHILPNTLESLSSVYQMPISEMERISSLDDKGYNTPSIINEISKYYILKEQKEIFEANHLKYVFEIPESPLKLLRKINNYTIKEVSSITNVSFSTISKAELLIVRITDNTISELSHAYNMPEDMIKELINKQSKGTNRQEILYMISRYYMNDAKESIKELEKSLGSIKYAK